MSEIATEAWRYFSDPATRGAEKQTIFARLPVEAPIVRYDRAWLVSGYDLVTALSTDLRCRMPRPTFPESTRRANPDFVEFFGSTMSVQDLDDHARLRRVLTREFTGRALQRLRGRIAGIVDDLLAEPLRTGHCEFVSDVAVPLPVMVTAALLDLPEEDWKRVLGWAEGLTAQINSSFPMGGTGGPEPISVESFAEMREYVDSTVRAREHSTAPDLVSRLNQAKAAGQVDHTEVVRMVMLLFMTGFDTVTSGLADTLLCLLRHPGEWRRVVADPGLAGAAFSESIRLATPVIMGVRQATADIPLAAGTVRTGDMVFLAYAAANLDPRRFPEPLEFRLGRPVANLSFGHGTYFCIGAALAALQAEAVLRALAAAAPGLTLATETFPWRREIAFHSPAELPLRLHADDRDGARCC